MSVEINLVMLTAALQEQIVLCHKSRTNQSNSDILEGYNRPTCNKQRTSGQVRVDRYRCNPQGRSSSCFVDNTIDLPWRYFLHAEFGTKFRREVPILLEAGLPEFSYDIVR